MAEQRSGGGGDLMAVLGITILIAFEIPNMFSGLLPSLFTIATFSGGGEEKVAHTKKWIRKGEIQATIMSLILGAGASAVAKKPWPFLASAAMCAYLVVQYENALRKGSSDGLKLDMRDGAA